MKLIISAVLLTLVADLTSAEESQLPKWNADTKKLMQLAANSTIQRAFDEYVQKYGTGKLAINKPFPCSTDSDFEPATSVHRLTPTDVKVVAAMGDSLTAGTGVKALTIIGLLTQWRGLSWSAGGDEDADKAPTLPNFIKKFNPDVRGYSIKTGSYKSSNAHLNVADPGAKAKEMPAQAQLLIERLKTEPGVDFNNDWKIITLFIGGNDLCDYCEDRDTYSTANYLLHVQTALDNLYANVPRAFVNLVQVLTVPMVEELNEGLICNTLHFFGCRCGAFPKNGAARQEIIDAGLAYRKALDDLVLSGRYDNREDFTVVLQPFLEETTPPRDPNNPDEPDLSYFAPDCFHFSEKGQAAAAEGLWNNMIEPEGQKRKSWTPDEEIICPNSANPFFATRQNSGDFKRKSSASRQAAVDTDLYHDDKQDNPGEQKGGNASPTAVILGCLFAVITVGFALGIALHLRKRRQRRNPESTSILLHSMGRVVYN